MASRKQRIAKRRDADELRKLLHGLPGYFTAAADPADCGPVEFLTAAAAEGDPPKLPTFKLVAYNGGLMTTVFPFPIIVDLAGMAVPNKARPVLREHDRTRIVGHTDDIAVAAARITVSGLVSGSGPDAAEIVQNARNKFPWQISCGWAIRKLEYVDEGATAEANGKTVKGPAYVVRKSALGEISFVALGGDDSTSAKVEASASAPLAAAAASHSNLEDRTMTFEKWLEAKGFDITDLGDAARAYLQAAYDAEQKPAPAPAPAAAPAPAPALNAAAPPDNQTVLAVRAEYARIAGINAFNVAQFPGLDAAALTDVQAKALKDAWTVEATELALLRAARPKARPPASFGRFAPLGEQGPTARVLEAALCLHHNVGDSKFLLAQYGDETLNRADAFRRLSLTRVMELVCAQAGVPIPLDVHTTDFLRAAFSTSELSGIVGNVANKALAAAFTSPDALVPVLAARRSHTNFFAHTIYSLGVSGDLEEVGPTGELHHLKLGEESWQRQVKTRGALLAITRTDMVNDELGAFVDNANRLSRKSLTSRERALFILINATGLGASFFTAARRNYITGANTAMGTTGLGLAIKAFRGLTDPDGNPTLVEPAILLATPSDEEAASRLIATGGGLVVTGLSSTAVKALEANSNIYAGRLGGRPRISPYLENAALPGYSVTAWFLLADPAVLAAFEVAYLNGVDTPVVEFFGLNAVADVLGVTWRVYYDFGVSTGEYRAGVKAKGAA